MRDIGTRDTAALTTHLFLGSEDSFAVCRLAGENQPPARAVGHHLDSSERQSEPDRDLVQNAFELNVRASRQVRHSLRRGTVENVG